MTAEQSSLQWQAVTARVAFAGAPGHHNPVKQLWAQQLTVALETTGVRMDLHQPQPTCKEALQTA